jgi:outer membrane protein assembly factor BamB
MKGGHTNMQIAPYAAVVLLLVSSWPAYAQQTSTFRGDPQHTGVYQTGGVDHFTRVKWSFHTHGYVVSSPAIADGTVYVGSNDGNLYAVDAASGTQKWKFRTGSRVASSPAVSDGIAYFGSYDGNFYAVDTATGHVKWKFKTAGERRFAGTHLHGTQPVAETMPDPFDVYLSSPVLSHGAVYFGSGDGNVYSLDAATGSMNWTFKTGDVVHASPAIDGGTLFVGSWDSYFYALDAATGAQKWRFKTGVDPDIHNQVGIQSSAAVVDGIVYFGCRDSHLYALDEQTGEKKWSFSTGESWVISSPAVDAGKVYFATSDSGLFYALDAKTGATIFSLNYKGWVTFSSPAIVGDMAYVGSNAGTLNAIDLKSHVKAWSFVTDAAKRFGPKYTNADGTPKYEAAYSSDYYDDLIIGYSNLMTIGAIVSSPVVADHVIYVGSTDGNLYALM